MSATNLACVISLAIDSLTARDEFAFVSVDKKKQKADIHGRMYDRKFCNVVKFSPQKDSVLIRLELEYLSFDFTHTAQNLIVASSGSKVEEALATVTKTGEQHPKVIPDFPRVSPKWLRDALNSIALKNKHMTHPHVVNI